MPIFTGSFLALIKSTGGDGENYQDFPFPLPELLIRPGEEPTAVNILDVRLTNGGHGEPAQLALMGRITRLTFESQIHSAVLLTRRLSTRTCWPDPAERSALGCLNFPSISPVVIGYFLTT